MSPTYHWHMKHMLKIQNHLHHDVLLTSLIAQSACGLQTIWWYRYWYCNTPSAGIDIDIAIAQHPPLLSISISDRKLTPLKMVPVKWM